MAKQLHVSFFATIIKTIITVKLGRWVVQRNLRSFEGKRSPSKSTGWFEGRTMSRKSTAVLVLLVSVHQGDNIDGDIVP